MSDLKLVIFDVDGTLIDSQAHIVASMNAAFAANGLPAPPRDRTLSIVGLSLPEAMARLAPDRPELCDALVDGYRQAFSDLRGSDDNAARSPMFPGALACLHALARQDTTLLAVATGKSRRGLDHVFMVHQIEGIFQSVQCADTHPSKPHPSMVEACLRDTGVDPQNAVIVGDTTFDIEMGLAGGIRAIGVGWGYHPASDLHAAGAAQVIDDFPSLPPALDRMWVPI